MRQRSARTLQRAYRVHRQHRLAEAAARRETAARLLERVARGFLARRHVAVIRQRLQTLQQLEADLATLLERRSNVVYHNSYLGDNGRPRWAALEFEDTLTKMLIKVDAVLSEGHDGVRLRRKRLIAAINRELEKFDRFRSGVLDAPTATEANATEAPTTVPAPAEDEPVPAEDEPAPEEDEPAQEEDEPAQEEDEPAQEEDEADDEWSDVAETADTTAVPASEDGRFRSSEAGDVVGDHPAPVEASPAQTLEGVLPTTPADSTSATAAAHDPPTVAGGAATEEDSPGDAGEVTPSPLDGERYILLEGAEPVLAVE